ncbi:sensor histidine kinase [Bacillus taeanensis]|uniref:histidine kinase n=1 Tax=Bacillus taeanensis TaxID=273032 RepID=A0A366Y191_9BACI|nr:HAMP domain-containing sensor histidine kinase [Bacillus taeanensis]RBW70184.1 two-component sensor histidine kinase [Bacillus taeanensis]
MKRISIKLSILFFISMLFIEVVLFIFLYYELLGNRIEDETKALLTRGNSHSNVLEKHFDMLTLKHVALMESEASTIVVITDNDKSILVNSDYIDFTMKTIMNQNKDIAAEGVLLESRWRTTPYLASASPILINNSLEGYVYMFTSTEKMRKVNDRLTFQFGLVGIFSFFLTAVTVFFLTKFITQPLIRMKKATEQIIQGNQTNSLDTERQDELGELAKSIQFLSSNLNRLKKERTDFLANIAHELRTPLTYLKGYADIAQRETISSKERKEYLKIITEEATHAAKLVSDLFHLAKMDQHSFPIHKQKVDIVKLLNELIIKVKPAYMEKGVRLELKGENQAFVELDEDRFSQVILNLLDNSLLYTEKGKKVSVEVSEEEDRIIILVRDQGEGIPKEELPFIWERLYRVDKSRSRKLGGTGLGLSIVKEIVEKHGGMIEAISELGVGTTMTIRLKKEG